MARRIVILCEDTQHEVLVRQWLKGRGLGEQVLRVEKNPAGRGSGEQYVRQRYPIEVAAHRREKSYSTLGPALIVMIDADNKNVNERFEELDRMLVEDKQAKRKNVERIAITVPKRNVETWLYYFQNNSVDEETEYPKLDSPGDCKQAVKGFLETHPNQPPEDAPASLKIAYQEIQRIL